MSVFASILSVVAGLVLCAMLIYGKKGTMVYLISLMVLEASIACSCFFPELVQPMTEKQHLTNMNEGGALGCVLFGRRSR